VDKRGNEEGRVMVVVLYEAQKEEGRKSMALLKRKKKNVAFRWRGKNKKGGFRTCLARRGKKRQLAL